MSYPVVTGGFSGGEVGHSHPSCAEVKSWKSYCSLSFGPSWIWVTLA